MTQKLVAADGEPPDMCAEPRWDGGVSTSMKVATAQDCMIQGFASPYSPGCCVGICRSGTDGDGGTTDMPVQFNVGKLIEGDLTARAAHFHIIAGGVFGRQQTERGPLLPER